MPDVSDLPLPLEERIRAAVDEVVQEAIIEAIAGAAADEAQRFVEEAPVPFERMVRDRVRHAFERLHKDFEKPQRRGFMRGLLGK